MQIQRLLLPVIRKTWTISSHVIDLFLSGIIVLFLFSCFATVYVAMSSSQCDEFHFLLASVNIM